MLYVVIAGILFSLYHVSSLFPKERSILFYYLALIGLLVFVGTRDEVGCDWFSYFGQFNTSYWLSWRESFNDPEPIWWAAMRSMTHAGWEYKALVFISAAIFFVGVHFLAIRQPNPSGFLAFLFPVLIINLPMSGIRQGVAIGLLCIAATRLIDGKAMRFAFWTALAATIHSSAAIFLLITPLVLPQLRPGAKVFIAALLAIPAVWLLAQGDAGQQAFDRYIETDSEAFGAAFRLAMLALSGAFYLVFLRKAWKRDFPQDHMFVTLGALAMIGVLAVLPISSVIADRLGYYLIPIQAMIFARIASLQEVRWRKFIALLPTLGMMAFLTAWATLSDHFALCYVPYHSWLIGDEIILHR
jgi:hypothetical protein